MSTAQPEPGGRMPPAKAGLNAAGTHLPFAELRSRLQDRMLRYGLLETLDRDHCHPTVKAAVTAVRESGTPLES